MATHYRQKSVTVLILAPLWVLLLLCPNWTASLRTSRSGHHEPRAKRDLADAMRIPGTRWCGRGWTAHQFYQLGMYSGADQCCRQHDLGCPDSIAPMESKYGTTNWRIYTAMHCSCDERFRTCLKMKNSAIADLVGQVFFNVIKTPCFVLSSHQVCSQRTWWGKCLQWDTKSQAIWRDSMGY